MLRPRSLQQRFSIFMIFPVLLLLIIMGIAGFVYARSLLLSQWREAAILKLQRAATRWICVLARPMKRFHSSGIREITPPRYDASIENGQEDDVTLVVTKYIGS